MSSFQITFFTFEFFEKKAIIANESFNMLNVLHQRGPCTLQRYRLHLRVFTSCVSGSGTLISQYSVLWASKETLSKFWLQRGNWGISSEFKKLYEHCQGSRLSPEILQGELMNKSCLKLCGKQKKKCWENELPRLQNHFSVLGKHLWQRLISQKILFSTLILWGTQTSVNVHVCPLFNLFS